MKTLIIAKETYSDIANIKQLERKVLATIIEQDESSLTDERVAKFDMVAQVSKGNVVFAVTLLDGDVVSVCRWGRVLDLENASGNEWIEWQVTTNESCRGKGLGKVTIEAGNEYIKNTYGANKIVATIWDWNQSSQRLHQKVGYKQCEWGEYKDSYYDDGEADEGKLMYEIEL